jgi:hypothetical protein
VVLILAMQNAKEDLSWATSQHHEKTKNSLHDDGHNTFILNVPISKSKITMGIVDDIKSNSIEELHLSNPPVDYFGTTEEFADAMKENTSIKTVIFDNDFLACAKGDDRAQIVSSLGALPNVEKVVLRDSFLNIGVCVTNLTKDAKKLSDLSMENCTLQGTPESFDIFVTALKGNGSLKNLEVTDCRAPHGDVDMTKVMADLRDGLSIQISGE